MKKTTIKKVLALVVGALIIAASLTAGFGVFAEETTPNAGPLNLDFSDGFNHWTGETSLYVVNEGVLKINEETYTSGSWKFLKTEPFTIPNAVAGTVIEMSFDVEFEDGLPSMNGNENQAGTLESNPANKILDVYLADPTIDTTPRLTACTEANGQRNQVFYNEEGTVVVGPQTIEDPAQVFDFWIGCGNSAKKTWQISNISLKVTQPNGTVVTYPIVPKYPAYLGTEDKGFSSVTVAGYKLKPLEGVFENLDFTDGFIGWSGRNGGATEPFAADCYDLVTEGDNKYVKVKDSGYVTSMRSAVFSVEGIEAGDSVTVLYDVKGDDGAAFHIALRQIVMKAGIAYDATTGAALTTDKIYASDHNVVGSGVPASDFAINLGPDGWTTRAGYKNVKVQELDPEGSDKYFLQVIVTCGDAGYTEAGDKIDAAIDNLKIAKVVDGVYTNVADGSVIYDPNAGSGEGGEGGAGAGTGTGTGTGNGGSSATGDSVLALAALFFVSGAAVFGTAKAMKNR